MGSAAATWSFTNATASGKHEVAANCTATGPCTFQKDVPWDLSFYVLGAIIFGIVLFRFCIGNSRFCTPKISCPIKVAGSSYFCSSSRTRATSG